jgi:hypothetical protein
MIRHFADAGASVRLFENIPYVPMLGTFIYSRLFRFLPKLVVTSTLPNRLRKATSWRPFSAT